MRRVPLIYRKFAFICLLSSVTGLILLYYSCRLQQHSTTSCHKDVTFKQKNIENNAHILLKHRLTLTNNFVPHILSALYVDFLPHLKYTDQTFLDPLVLLKENNVFRSPAHVLIAIPSAYRIDVNYLFETLSSLFNNLVEEERYLVQFVVMLAERDLTDPIIVKYVNDTIDGIRRTYPREVEDGIIEVIMPPLEWYPPNLNSIPPTFNDSQQRMTWRTKQSLDYAYLMLYARTFFPHFKYYVQLEDDVDTIQKYATAMKHFGDTHNGWVMCEFSHLGFIGKMFRQSDLFFVTQFILLLYRELPVDWIMDQLLVTKYCPRTNINKCDAKRMEGRIRLRRRPPLFQHKGRHSSLPGKIQKLRENTFNARFQPPINLEKTGNPEPAKLNSNIGGLGQESLMDFYTNSTPIQLQNVSASNVSFIEVLYPYSTQIRELALHYSFIVPQSAKENGTVLWPAVPPFDVFIKCASIDPIDCPQSITKISSDLDSMFLHKFNSPVNISQISVKKTDIFAALFSVIIWLAVLYLQLKELEHIGEADCEIDPIFHGEDDTFKRKDSCEGLYPKKIPAFTFVDALPHLRNQAYLDPIRLYRNRLVVRRPAEIIFGIPATHHNVMQIYGFLQIIIPPAIWFALNRTYNSSLDLRHSLSTIYLMLYAAHYYPYSKYYVQLADDIRTRPDYMKHIYYLASNPDNYNWLLMELSRTVPNPRNLGQMFKIDRLSLLYRYAMLLYGQLSMEQIVNSWVHTCSCYIGESDCIMRRIIGKRMFRSQKALFQHCFADQQEMSTDIFDSFIIADTYNRTQQRGTKLIFESAVASWPQPFNSTAFYLLYENEIRISYSFTILEAHAFYPHNDTNLLPHCFATDTLDRNDILDITYECSKENVIGQAKNTEERSIDFDEYDCLEQKAQHQIEPEVTQNSNEFFYRWKDSITTFTFTSLLIS
ncbi:n-Acetylglucosaminyltransferase-IV (GnT-IV) conserved region domain-containing protein [Ditylenchus destructor]|nr:n-Acetylglucosaminyltransferase-IV (GnT-IV) conserved region domain-containing protein [Ditylenchus destructor]